MSRLGADCSSHPLKAPRSDLKVKEYFSPYYEKVFILLHPLLKIEKRFQYVFDREDGPTRSEQARYITPLSWSQAIGDLGVGSLGSLNEILLEAVGAIRTRDSEALSRVVDLMEHKCIRYSSEGDIPQIILDDILRSFTDFGYTRACVSDEFGDRKTIWEISDLLALEYPVLGEAHPALYPEDCSMLYCTHWDSFFTFLCGSQERVQRIVDKYNFEGFYAGEKTTVLWHETEAI